jgi:hypothetical protein
MTKITAKNQLMGEREAD